MSTLSELQRAHPYMFFELPAQMAFIRKAKLMRNLTDGQCAMGKALL